MLDTLNPAYDIYDVFKSLEIGEHHIILRLEDEVDKFGDCDRYDAAGFASKILEFLVGRVDEVLGNHVFYDGEGLPGSPNWINFLLLAYWDHGGHFKYLAWSEIDAHHSIVVGKARR